MKKKALNRKKVNPYAHVFTGVKYHETTNLQLFKYNSTENIENKNYTIDEFKGVSTDGYQYWLNVYGIHDVDCIQKICNNLNVHNLVIQDILDVNQRPKFQEYENYLFFTIKSMLPTNDLILEQEQLSFILGNNYLISFQERKSDHFDHIRERLRNKLGIVRERSADFLLFLLLEAILDNYFTTTNNIADRTEKLSIIEPDEDPSPELLKTIEFYKRQIHQIKKTVLPIRDFITKIEREHTGLIQDKHMKYYYEIKDLSLTIIDECEQIGASLESNINLFFSIQGNRMNKVMKTLTVVGSIFIPLTFMVGIYGMNFKHMPELDWYWGYFSVWIAIVGVVMGMLYYFKKKNWF